MSTHPYMRKEKVRTGWGKWEVVIIRKCTETGQEIRIRKNWHGPKPPGATECPHCHKSMDL